MPTHLRPLVAYVVRPGLRPRYGVYSDAYGLEMTFDDDWDVDVILFSKPKLVEHIATQTRIHESSSLSLGLTRPSPAGSSNYASWQIVDLTRRLAPKRISPDLKPLIVTRSAGDLERFTSTQPLSADREFAVAFHIAGNLDAGTTARTVLTCREMLDAGSAGRYRLLIDSPLKPTADSVLANLPIAGVDGVFCRGSEYSEMLPFMSAATRCFHARPRGG